MTQPGWYPDPTGQGEGSRYWDGNQWTDQVLGAQSTPTPQPPRTPAPSEAHIPASASIQMVTPAPGLPLQKKKSPRGFIIGIIAGVVVLALVGYLVWSLVLSSPTPEPEPTTSPTAASPSPSPTASTAADFCPQQGFDKARKSHPNDDRVYGGQLSYPRASAPWTQENPAEGSSLPFGRDVGDQYAEVHTFTDGEGNLTSWGASMFVGELVTDDEMTLQEADAMVRGCIIAAFYDAHVTDFEVVSPEPWNVDGYDAWYSEMVVAIDYPGLPTTTDFVVVVIVDTGGSSYSFFTADQPADAPGLQGGIDEALQGLRVEPV